MKIFWRRLFEHGEEWLLGATLAFMAAMTFAQVASRYCLHRSISFTEELVRYLMIWVTMLGIAVAAKRRSHIGVHFTTLLFPRTRRWLSVFAGACACLFFAILVVYGGAMVWQEQRSQTTSALHWPMWWVGVSIPIGGALAILRTLQACWRAWRDPGSTEPRGAAPASGEGE